MLINPRSMLTSSGQIPSDCFNPEIRDSWKRCYQAGLDPFGRPAQVQISSADLDRRKEQMGLLWRLACIETRNLYWHIAGSNFIIIFADSDGVILDSITDYSNITLNNERTNPGFSWRERNNVTNALGLVAETGLPAVVHGDEHYFRDYEHLTCAAAPIYGPQGKTLGIIDATSNCRSRQRHTLALVQMSCITIENGLFRERNRHRLIFEIHNRREFLSTLQSALLAFDETGVLQEANRQAQFLLQGTPLESGHDFEEIFRTSFEDTLYALKTSGVISISDSEGSTFTARTLSNHVLNQRLKPTQAFSLPKSASDSKMVCCDKAFKEAMHMVKRAVELNVPILIQGETGTGKELMAKYAHAVSGRDGDFVAVNCATLPKSLVESELFGYVEGSFTGAVRGGSKGLIQQAHGGTLFLDEIATMSNEVQTKLLRFLDRMEIRPLGKTRDIQIDLQLISASNAKITGSKMPESFRADLLYRINTMEVCLPPLRERSDLKAIIDAIVGSFERPFQLDGAALDLLHRHRWPGNIRELKAVLIRLLIASEGGVVNSEDVQKIISVPDDEGKNNTDSKLVNQERSIILNSYEKNKGNISAVARELVISRNTVYKKLKEIRRAQRA